MFDSGIKVADIVGELKNTEVDIALDIPNKTYVEWLNSLQQLLYTEVIKEQKKFVEYFASILPVIPQMKNHTFDLSDIEFEGEADVRFEDVYAVYADDTQLIKSTLTSGVIFPNTYYKEDNLLGYRAYENVGELTIIYIVRPALIEVDGEVIDNSNVMLPVEFIDLAKAKLRGEAYKLANEDGIAAKWMNDYNVLLENFKAWITTKSANFGM